MLLSFPNFYCAAGAFRGFTRFHWRVGKCWVLAGCFVSVRAISPQRYSRSRAGGFGVLRPARRMHIRRRGRVLPNPRTPRSGSFRCRRRNRPRMARSGPGVASLALIPPYGRNRALSRAIRGRSASRGFVAGYRSSPRSRLGASVANRPPAAALRSLFGLALRSRPNKRWRLPVRRLLRAPASGGTA